MSDAEMSEVKETGAKQKSKAVKPRTLVILIGLVIVAAIAGLVWFLNYQSYGKYQQETNDARVEADIVTVSPRIAGNVAQVLVADNQDVRVGQPLVRVDPRDPRARAEQADAQIAVAQAQADAARAQIGEQRDLVAQAEAQLTAARRKAAFDAAEVARVRPLVQSGAEARQRLLQLETTAGQSADNVRALAASAAAQRQRIASIQGQVRQGEAQADAARAQRSAADIDVGATLIRATTAGRIGNRTVRPGQYVQAGTRLMSIVPLDRMYVTANFKETQLALMRPGQPVRISVDALDGITIKGKVESVSPGTGAQFSILPPQNATGNFTKITQRVPVQIAIAPSPAAKRLLVPGLSVVVTVDTLSAKGDLDHVRAQED